MLHKYYLVVLEGSNVVDSAVKRAADFNVQALYKIGVYGKEKQHELFISGSFLNCHRFMRTWKREHPISNNSTEESA